MHIIFWTKLFQLFVCFDKPECITLHLCNESDFSALYMLTADRAGCFQFGTNTLLDPLPEDKYGRIHLMCEQAFLQWAALLCTTHDC